MFGFHSKKQSCKNSSLAKCISMSEFFYFIFGNFCYKMSHLQVSQVLFCGLSIHLPGASNFFDED